MALLDAQVIEHGDVIGRVRVPAVARADGTARPAARVALVHHDHAEVGGELGDRVHRRGRTAPDLDGRLQPCRCERENGEPAAGLLEVDGSAPVLNGRHERLLSVRYRLFTRDCRPVQAPRPPPASPRPRATIGTQGPGAGRGPATRCRRSRRPTRTYW